MFPAEWIFVQVLELGWFILLVLWKRVMFFRCGKVCIGSIILVTYFLPDKFHFAEKRRDTMDDSCAVCAEPLQWVAYGPCGHREVCSTCTIRLRFICEDSRCCICKSESKIVFVTKVRHFRCLPSLNCKVICLLWLNYKVQVTCVF